MLRKKQLIIKSKDSELHRLEEFVEQISDVYNVNSNYYSNILVALTEAVTNSIIHGNKGDKNADIQILFQAKNKGLFFTVKDQGRGFDFDHYPDPTDINIPDYENIGKGLYLMKSLSDAISYNPEDGVEIGFKISSINKELAVSRTQSLQAYFKTNETHIKA